MDKDIYEKLRESIDKYSVGFNATKSGIEMKILKKVFTPEEAHIYINLTQKLETAAVIADRAGRDANETASLLESMSRKGVTFPIKKNDEKYYAAAPFMHGFFENQAVSGMDRELAEMYEEYIRDGFFPKAAGLRAVPVNISVNNGGLVLPYDDVKDIINSKTRIGVMKCACAAKKKVLETGCKKPDEVCIAFDFYAEYGIEGYGAGRWITRDEALKILEETEKAGLVHQVGGSSGNIECICNCCPDCCVGLAIYKKFPQPAKVAGSNYFASVESGECTGCENCIGRCPMEAITASDGTVSINLDRCIGCGLCAGECPAEAITLHKKPENEIRGPLPPERYRFMRSSLDFQKDIE